ncbi:uncharacterized protein LOC113358302 [Papaver somniferum]|uniref:uncharacterized protein LOC113358302 n=1 Tax=Papaver somniferum TaxID=3469 RepID=UPI000E6FE5AE|nr:uncharacterized protein LOC113358302 [Papaver somniferum]
MVKDGAPPPPPPSERKTLRDLTSPCLDSQPLCITLNATVELKSNLLHWVPKFKGLLGEDPNRHLQQFQNTIRCMKKSDDNDDTTFLQAFPFSLTDQAESWLYYLPSGSITTWTRMKKLFLEKYFPASKATSIRKEISGTVQILGESLYDYWERYKRLLASFPHHQIPPQLIITHFYKGLLPHERHLIDASSSGALANKTIEEATSLIESMAANVQQFYTRDSSVVRRVSEMGDSSHIEQQIGNVEKMVQRITSAVIPTYEDDAEVNVIFPNQRQRYDPYSNTYNPGWKDHPNFSYVNKQVAAPNPYARKGGFQQSQLQPQTQQQTQSSSLEEMMKVMMQEQKGISQKQDAILQQNLQYQQKNDVVVRHLQIQMGQMATDMNFLKTQTSTKFPSQPFVNPREWIGPFVLTNVFAYGAVEFIVIEMGQLQK